MMRTARRVQQREPIRGRRAPRRVPRRDARPDFVVAMIRNAARMGGGAGRRTVEKSNVI